MLCGMGIGRVRLEKMGEEREGGDVRGNEMRII